MKTETPRRLLPTVRFVFAVAGERRTLECDPNKVKSARNFLKLMNAKNVQEKRIA